MPRVIPEPRLATTMCVLAPVEGGLRVLMVRRSPVMRFMPGAWVFPGGVIDPADDSSADRVVPGATEDHRTWATAGVREVFEETGIWLSDPPVTISAADRPAMADLVALVSAFGPVDGSAVLHLSTWVTPTAVPVRFHTRFSVTPVRRPVDGEPDGVEVDDVSWVDPGAAVAAGDAGDIALPLPTRHTLIELADLGSVDAVVERVTNHGPRHLRPRLRLDGDTMVALVPGDDGFDETPELPPDPDALGRVMKVRDAHGRPVPEIRPPGRSAR